MVTDVDYNGGKFICLSERKQLNMDEFFRRQDGSSLMG